MLMWPGKFVRISTSLLIWDDELFIVVWVTYNLYFINQKAIIPVHVLRFKFDGFVLNYGMPIANALGIP